MRFFWFAIAMVAGLALAGSRAEAQWIYKADENAFGPSEQLVMTAKEGVISGFRCQTADNLALVFITTEKPSGDSATMRLMPVNLLVIVDDAPKVTLQASIDVTPQGERYRVTSDDANDVRTVMLAAMRAKRRFAVAVELLGSIAYTKTFGVAGLGRDLRRLADGCKISAPSG